MLPKDPGVHLARWKPQREACWPPETPPVGQAARTPRRRGTALLTRLRPEMRRAGHYPRLYELADGGLGRCQHLAPHGCWQPKGNRGERCRPPARPVARSACHPLGLSSVYKGTTLTNNCLLKRGVRALDTRGHAHRQELVTECSGAAGDGCTTLNLPKSTDFHGT